MPEQEDKTVENGNRHEATAPADSAEPKQAPASSQSDAFGGDEAFYKLLEAGARAASAKYPSETAPKERTQRRYFSTRQIGLLCATIVGTMIILYGIAKLRTSTPSIYEHTSQPIRQTPNSPPEASARISTQVQAELPSNIRASEIPDSRLETQVPPVSLKLAHDFFSHGNYQRAFEAYDRLHQVLSASQQQECICDYLALRKALCLRNMRKIYEAEQLLRYVSQSDCPALAALANYFRAIVEYERDQLLQARACAYRALALSATITFDQQSAQSLSRNCRFLVAQTLTKKLLLLSDADDDIPAEYWSAGRQSDPFERMSQEQLASMLGSGTDELSKGLMGPNIRKLAVDDIVDRFEVVSFAAPLEEVLARVAANADLAVSWQIGPNFQESRKRSVSMLLPDATAQEAVEVAAGCAGLIADVTRAKDKAQVVVSNPMDYLELSEHTALLSRSAIAQWKQFVIRFHDDKRLPDAHFGMGLLLAQEEKVPEAVAQLKLVANGFPRSVVAPYALFHSSRLKTDLRDYSAATADLKQLLEQYPEAEIVPKACFYLAEATARSGAYKQAAKLYRKVYYLDDSVQSKTSAAFGAADCLYSDRDFENAKTWITRYFNISKDERSAEMRQAYLLQGKVELAMGKPKQACESFRMALFGKLNETQRRQIICALLDGGIEQLSPVRAIEMLESLQKQRLSGVELSEVLLLRSRILRNMGLPEKGMQTVAGRVDYLPESQLKARAMMELAICCEQAGDIKGAYDYLSIALTLVKPGALMQQAEVGLARVCVRLGKYEQTISLCSRLVKEACQDDLRRQASTLLAVANKEKKEYDKAAAALIAQWDQAESNGEKSSPEEATIAGGPAGEEPSHEGS